MELDPFEELERMAAVATSANDEDPEDEEIERWMKLFKYNYFTAMTLIQQHRADVTRKPISDEHWELVRGDREAAGYDREAYEHSLGLKDLMKSQSTTFHDADGHTWTLFRLGGLLGDAQRVKEIAGLEELPKVTYGMGSTGEATFVWVDSEATKRVENWLEMRQVEKAEVGER